MLLGQNRDTNVVGMVPMKKKTTKTVLEYEPKFGSFRTTCRVRVGRNNDVDVEHSGNLGRWLTRRERASCRCVSLAAFCKPPLVLSLSLSLFVLHRRLSFTVLGSPLQLIISRVAFIFVARPSNDSQRRAVRGTPAAEHTHTPKKTPNGRVRRSLDVVIPFD